MSQADDLLAQGDIDGARAALIETVRASPQDAAARMYLFQVLALLGEWDKASTHLRALASLSPEAQMLSVVYNQALDAEKARALALKGQGAIDVLIPGPDWVQGVADSLSALGRGDIERSQDLRNAAFEAAAETPGLFNGQAFEWVADADSRFGPTFEAIIAGRWGLVAFESVLSLKSEGPIDLRDLVWLPVQISFKSGQSAAALLPARYPGTEFAEPGLRLGRRTEWDGQTGAGLGQRLWSFDTDEDVGLLELRSVEFQ